MPAEKPLIIEPLNVLIVNPSLRIRCVADQAVSNWRSRLQPAGGFRAGLPGIVCTAPPGRGHGRGQIR
jgi:hypothetical protein